MTAVGDWSVAICDRCSKRVKTIAKVRDLPLEKPPIVVKDLIVFVCTGCDEIVSIPNSSTPKIKEAIDEHGH